MNNFTVVVTDYGFADLAPERAVLEPLGFRFVTGQCKTPDETAELTQDADAVLTQWAPVTSSVIDRMNHCKIIVRYGIGVDNVDLDAAARKNIPVVNVPDYAIQEVADHTFALLLTAVRKIDRVARQVKMGRWEIAPCRPIMSLQHKTLGLAGFGNIARAVARRARAFDLKVIAYDPYLDEDTIRQHGAEKVEWGDLIGRSDILSLHLPLNDSTRHLLNRDALRSMKPTACVINTSRGSVIDTEALAEALQNGQISGAALDVLEQEPIPADSPLLDLDNCLVTSHYAWYSEESLAKLQQYAALEVKRLFTGEHPKHVVNGVDCTDLLR